MNEGRKLEHLEDISPFCVWRMLLRNFWMILACAGIFAMSAGMYCDCLRQDEYQASITYAVTARETSYNVNRNNTVSQEVVAVITELIGTDVLREEIRACTPELALFNGSIRANRVGESNLIAVSATATSSAMAFHAIEAVVQVLPELSYYISDNAVLQLLQNPTVSARPVNQINSRQVMLCAGIVGAALMVVFLVWVNVSAQTVQTSSGARHLLDAGIVATIGHENKNPTLRSKLKNSNRGLQVFAPSTSFAYSEQINAVCARLEHEAETNGCKLLMITGVGENEGKSTVAANVASMLAMKGKQVALVDADLRKPALTRFFDGAYHSSLPLDQLLEQPYSRDNVRRCMVRHPKLGLYMLFSTATGEADSQLLTGDTMRLLLQQLRVFDYVIIDTPPMGIFADAELLAELVDASMLVVRQDYTAACDINDAADTLRSSSSRFLGCVLNDMRGHGLGTRGYGYGYGYGKQRGDRGASDESV